MSKIKSDFMKKLAEEQGKTPLTPTEEATETQSKAVENDFKVPVADDGLPRSAKHEEESSNVSETLNPEATHPQEEPSKMGRPSSFPAGEKKERVMVTLTEVDKEALRLFQETTSGARDRSEIVRAALAEYIPDNIYSMANMMVKMKRKA